ncbi:MAG: prephenate dehydrogenase/arogenate dehydrogenase family protein [Clostridiales bacterium]|nr:prephenate dehydrogenase/arogenate dehydrogenase family protein [Clostridiales bacterium]
MMCDKTSFSVGVVGLGLIGGSIAKAYKKTGHTVYGYDKNHTVTEFGILSDVLDGELTRDKFAECDLILVSAYPEASIDYINQNAEYFPKNLFVIDCCGTKAAVCRAGFEAAEKYGFTFVGGHPMAGTHNSGFKYSRADLFIGAPMVIVPPKFDDITLLDHIKFLLSPVGFGSISVTTAEEHDKMIAFTSQLAHIVSSAYIKSPTASQHRGFSAGSYRDMTRVAWLNPTMWSELFLENREPLLFELDTVIENLTMYRDAIADEDSERLWKLLDDGRRRKEEVDGNMRKK